jgi:DNA-directed RNA polymerase II subunit RPB2
MLSSKMDKPSINKESIFKLIDFYFASDPLYKFQHDSYDQFINDIVFPTLKESPNIISENVFQDKIYRHRLEFSEIALKPPVNEIDDELIFPEDARLKHLNYSGKLIANVKQMLDIIEAQTGAITTKLISEDKEVPVARIPIMLRSRYCNTVLRPDIPNTECYFDPGCYFIVGSSGNIGERVILTHERICENKSLVLTKRDPGYKRGKMFYIQITSKTPDILGMINVFTIRMNKNDSIVCLTRQFAEIPLFVLFRALGIISDNDIIKYCTYDDTDLDMINVLRYSLDDGLYAKISDEAKPKEIRTQEDAINFLMARLKNNKKYSETDAVVREQQKKVHVMKILENELLPHVTGGLHNKACYLGYMINKLMLCYLGRIEEDDRDSYVNKRLWLPGVLLGQIFKSHYNKMLNNITKFFKKKNNDDNNPIKIINQIKPNIIEDGLKSALLTGTWTDRRKGVAQVLQRLSYLQTISYYRKIITPSPDASNNKITTMRQVNNIQLGFVCVVETPEGQKIGLVKGMALTATPTMTLYSQIPIIKKLLSGRMLELASVTPYQYKQYVKVLLNGDWIGMTDKPNELHAYLLEKRKMQELDYTVSIMLNYSTKELKVYCDGGRLVRPLLNVRNNELVLKPEMLDEIDADDVTGKKINKFSDFLIKHPDVFDFVDVETTESTMISMTFDQLNEEKTKMLTDVKDLHTCGDPVNRYDKIYVKYTHCELHPSMMLGSISANIPYSNHNYGNRNILFFSQSRHAIGIYASNYRYRTDKSYLLYHPQTPVVTTKAAKWLHTQDIPAGENCVVAIMCYTGFNQEDSKLVNKSGVDRGLLRVTVLDKKDESIEKNPTTSLDDIFMRPDKTKTVGMKDAKYDKLNERGFVPEETVLENNDVLIGKVSPILKDESNKVYRDSSNVYRSTVPSTVDKVYTVTNGDGYEMYNMRLRSERPIQIGDKLCLTDDHDVLTQNRGWIPINEIKLVDKVGQLNPITNQMEYVNPVELFEYNMNNEDIYEVESQGVSLRTTLNHRMWVQLGDKFDLIEAKDIINKNVEYATLDDNYASIKCDMSNKKEQVYKYSGKVYCIQVPTHIFMVRRNGRIVWTGNSTRHGQKGTTGALVTSCDMPFTASGIQPDVILNPNCIPSRMTIAQLLEAIYSKVGALECDYVDGTPFQDNNDITDANEILRKYGFEDYGLETMYSGFTGEKMEARIFLCPTYYLRLKHLAMDKMHARASGPKQILTRQPPDGRARDGGLRWGEMERDVGIAHGAAFLLREKLLEASDKYMVYVCNICGLFANKMPKKDVYHCQSCKNSTRISKVILPYAFKLLIQELMSVQILPRLKVKEDEFA